uniref:OSJNBb0108J11.8 protein n=1 Tax=Oryza sativa subsp. japonica TaxID=39947 RepID=Q7XQY3_ORYSJ|nr:OSJNBb0108J11.8 [Oryza sativa Japonica Group]
MARQPSAVAAWVLVPASALPGVLVGWPRRVQDGRDGGGRGRMPRQGGAGESELLRCRGATKLGNDDTMQSLYWIIDASWQCTLDTALYLDAISSLSWNISNVPKLQQSLIEQMLSHNNEIPGLISGGFMKA